MFCRTYFKFVATCFTIFSMTSPGITIPISQGLEMEINGVETIIDSFGREYINIGNCILISLWIFPKCNLIFCIHIPSHYLLEKATCFLHLKSTAKLQIQVEVLVVEELHQIIGEVRNGTFKYQDNPIWLAYHTLSIEDLLQDKDKQYWPP